MVERVSLPDTLIAPGEHEPGECSPQECVDCLNARLLFIARILDGSYYGNSTDGSSEEQLAADQDALYVAESPAPRDMRFRHTHDCDRCQNWRDLRVNAEKMWAENARRL